MVELVTLVIFIKVLLTLVILTLPTYYFIKARKMEEWERRILIVALFYAVHQLSFYLDEFIFQLTNTLFVISLLFAITHVFSFESRLKKLEEEKKRLL